jgi:glycosyltransferase involved in cell wall biosynthesis
MPLSLLEAAAAGIPVISTPVGNIPSLLNNGNGYLGNVNEFPLLIEKVMDNYGEALIRARSLMQIVVEQFDIASCYRKHKQLYLQL